METNSAPKNKATNGQIKPLNGLKPTPTLVAKVETVEPVQPVAPTTPEAEPAQPAPYPTPEDATAPVTTTPTPAVVEMTAPNRADLLKDRTAKLDAMTRTLVQLDKLKAGQDKLTDLKFNVDQEDDRTYALLVIKDDRGNEFSTKNPNLMGLAVEFLLDLFAAKVNQKESDLLSITI